jgi:hypothetical protein
MAMPVLNNALLQCSFGVAPSPLTVIPQGPPVQIENQFAATIMDHIPMANIKPFGMCSSLANPTVASATAAALGVLTPMPCVPVTPAPWVPGVPTVQINNQMMLDNNCKLMCNWAGVIQVQMAGVPPPVKESVP